MQLQAAARSYTSEAGTLQLEAMNGTHHRQKCRMASGCSSERADKIDKRLGYLVTLVLGLLLTIVHIDKCPFCTNTAVVGTLRTLLGFPPTTISV